MPQLSRTIVKERARRLRERGATALRRYLDAEVGMTRRVLVKSPAQGRTEQFTQVSLGTPAEPGAIAELKMVGHDGKRLLAA